MAMGEQVEWPLRENPEKTNRRDAEASEKEQRPEEPTCKGESERREEGALRMTNASWTGAPS
jgi:hypothetical protein